MDLSQTNLKNKTTKCQNCKSFNILITTDDGTSGYCGSCDHLVYHIKCKYTDQKKCYICKN